MPGFQRIHSNSCCIRQEVSGLVHHKNVWAANIIAGKVQTKVVGNIDGHTKIDATHAKSTRGRYCYIRVRIPYLYMSDRGPPRRQRFLGIRHKRTDKYTETDYERNSHETK